MAPISKTEIIQKMEELKNGVTLGLRLGEVFGAGLVLIELNPLFPQKGQKKYLMRWGKSEAEIKAQSPFMTTDKPKSIAGWIADRAPQWAPAEFLN
jgi:hypothetical protein